jgi:segregation and condensation protein A
MTKQFLSYLSELPKLDMDMVSEFIEVAATLIEIKGRQILPKPTAEEEDSDPEETLRRMIEEYNLFKDAGEQLRSIDNVNRFYRSPILPKVMTEWKLSGVTMNDLTDAFAKMLSRVGEQSRRIEKTTIKLDRFTVADKIKDIVGRLKCSARFCFSDLFLSDMTRGEVVNTFLAVLELLRTQAIAVRQEQDFADIEIVKGGTFGNGNNVFFESEFGYFTAKNSVE